MSSLGVEATRGIDPGNDWTTPTRKPMVWATRFISSLRVQATRLGPRHLLLSLVHCLVDLIKAFDREQQLMN